MKTSRMASPPLVVAFAIAVGTAGVACDKGSSSGGAAEQPSASAAPSASAPTTAPSASSASGDASSSADAAASADEEQAVDELQNHHRHHHQGFAGFVISSIETLGVGADQQAAVDAIRKEFRSKMKPLHEANSAVLQALADGVAAGTIDKAKVDAAVGHAGTASAGLQGAIPTLLNQLHAALRPEQRVALVDKVDAHWATWRDVNTTDHTEDATKADRRFKHTAKELGLSSDQADKFRANLDASKDTKKPFDPATAEAYVKAFDAAFVADTFDAKKLPGAGPDNVHVVSWGAERMAWFYEALTPVLTADQRTQLAEKLHQRALGPDAKDKDKP